MTVTGDPASRSLPTPPGLPSSYSEPSEFGSLAASSVFSRTVARTSSTTTLSLHGMETNTRVEAPPTFFFGVLDPLVLRLKKLLSLFDDPPPPDLLRFPAGAGRGVFKVFCFPPSVQDLSHTRLALLSCSGSGTTHRPCRYP